MLKRLMTGLFQFGKHKNSDVPVEEEVLELLEKEESILEEHELTVEVALGAAATTLAEAMAIASEQQKPEVLDKIAHSWILLSQALEKDPEKTQHRFGFVAGDDNDSSQDNA